MREQEYVTINFDKKNFGLKGLELADIILISIGLLVFILLALFIKNIFVAIAFIVLYAFLLAPISLSNKNRIYKLIFMIFIFLTNKHFYIYQKNEKEGVLNESYQRLKEIKSKVRQKLDSR